MKEAGSEPLLEAIRRLVEGQIYLSPAMSSQLLNLAFHRTVPAAPSQVPQPEEQTYSYYCWARTQDGTEYKTAVMSEPTPHDKDFTAKAKQAWIRHLSDSLSLTKVNARCGEGPTSTVSTWAADSPNTKHVDWRYQP
jgi:hypothetical protein